MRKITLKDSQVQVEGNIPKKYRTNQVSTTLFNRYNFLILGLWYKLQSFVNIYLIFVMVLSLIPSISPIIPWTAVVPVIIVIMFNLLFDWKQDLNRYRQDCKVNHEKVMVIRNYEIQEIKSQNIKIGDIMLLQNNREVMADCIIIGFKSKKDCAFIQTKNLDGETNLKPKYLPFDYNFQEQDFLYEENDIGQLILELQNNSQYLDSIEGEATFLHNEKKQKKILDIENFIPRGTTLKNTEEAICIVTYVGPETKIRLNTAKRIEKRSEVEKNLDRHLQKIIFVQFLLILIIYFASLAEKTNQNFQKDVLKHEESWELHFLAIIGGYFLLLRKFLPLSIFFIHVITKLIQNGVFVLNKKYKDFATNQRCGINSYNLAENLGQIQYVLMDKTGTLTQNLMKCKFFMIGNHEVDLKISENNSTVIPSPPFKEVILQSQDRQSFFVLNSQEKMNELFYTLINVCHDCYADFKEGKDIKSSNIKYQGSSHDELALLRACKNELNYFMYHQGQEQTLIRAFDKDIAVDRLYKIPFNSTRKKMSVLVKYKENYFMMTKGAESILRKSSTEKLSSFFEENYKRYDDLGYRTLFTGIKLLSQNEYEQFSKNILKCKENGNIEEIKKLENKLEEDIIILGATAVEDRLQEDVQDTLQSLRKSNLKLWMITGDKTETAINIGKSTGLVHQNDNCKILNEDEIDKITSCTISSCGSIQMKLQPDLDCSIESSIIQNNQDDICVISGDVLSTISQNEQKMFKLGSYLANQEVVIFSRASPNQKVEIVRILKDQGKIVLAIGDGANDVNMIQEANVGVGIIGNEGKQAERCADYFVPKFKFLKPLILIFGRKNYFKNSQLINLYFWKSFLFSMPIFYFSFFSKMSRKNVYPDIYITFQDLLFTLLIYPFRIVGDVDINTKQKGYRKNLLLETYCYFKGQQNTYFDFKTYAKYYFTACFESLIIFIFLYILTINNAYYYNHSWSLEIFSVQVYTCLHYYQFFKLFFYIRSYNGFTVFFLIFMFAIYVSYAFFTNGSRVLSYKDVWQKSFTIGPFYIYITLVIGTLVLLSAIYFTIQHYMYPSILNKIEQSNLKVKDQELEEKLEDWRLQDKKRNLKNFLLRQFNLIMIQNREQILELIQKLLSCQNSNELKQLENQRDAIMKDTLNFVVFSFQILESNNIQKKEFQYICALLKNIANKIQERSIQEGKNMGDYLLKFLFGNKFSFLDKQMFCEMLSLLLNTGSQNFYMKEKLREYLFDQIKENYDFENKIILQDQQGILFFFMSIYNTRKLLAPRYADANITKLMLQFEQNFIKPLLKEEFFKQQENKNLSLENIQIAANLKFVFLNVYRTHAFKQKVVEMSQNIEILDYIMLFLAFNVNSQQLKILINSSCNQQENFYLNQIKKFSLLSFQILFKLFIEKAQKCQQIDVIQMYISIVQFNINGVLTCYQDKNFNIQNVFLSENSDLKEILEVNLRIFYTAIKQDLFRNLILDSFETIITNIILVNLLLDDQTIIQIEDNNEIHLNIIEDQINVPIDNNIQSYSAKFLHICCKEIDFACNFLCNICFYILSKNFNFEYNESPNFNIEELKTFSTQLSIEQQTIICFKVFCIILKSKQNNCMKEDKIIKLSQLIQNSVSSCSETIQIYYMFFIKKYYFLLKKSEQNQQLSDQIFYTMTAAIKSNLEIHQQISVKFFNKLFKSKGTITKIDNKCILDLFVNIIQILQNTNNLQIFNLLFNFDTHINQILIQHSDIFQEYMRVVFQRLIMEIKANLLNQNQDCEFLYQLLNLLKLYTNQKEFCQIYFHLFEQGLFEVIKVVVEQNIDYDLEILEIVQNIVVYTNIKLMFHDDLLAVLQKIQESNKGRVHHLLKFYDNVILRFKEDLNQNKLSQILIQVKKGLNYIIQNQETLVNIESILIFIIIFIEKFYKFLDLKSMVIINDIYNLCKEIDELPYIVQKYLCLLYFQLLSKDFNNNPIRKDLNIYIDCVIKLHKKYNNMIQKRFLITYLIRIFIVLDQQQNQQNDQILSKILSFVILFIKKTEINQIEHRIHSKIYNKQPILEELEELEIQKQINSYIQTQYDIQTSTNDSSDNYSFSLDSNNFDNDNGSDQSLDQNCHIELKNEHLQTNEILELQNYFKQLNQNDSFAIQNHQNSLLRLSQNFFIQILTQMVYFSSSQEIQIRRIVKINKNLYLNQLILQKK